MKKLRIILAFPEAAIGLFFVAMTIIGLSEALSIRGIDPRPMQVGGYLLMAVMVVKLVAKAVDYARER